MGNMFTHRFMIELDEECPLSEPNWKEQNRINMVRQVQAQRAKQGQPCIYCSPPTEKKALAVGGEPDLEYHLLV